MIVTVVSASTIKFVLLILDVINVNILPVTVQASTVKLRHRALGFTTKPTGYATINRTEGCDAHASPRNVSHTSPKFEQILGARRLLGFRIK